MEGTQLAGVETVYAAKGLDFTLSQTVAIIIDKSLDKLFTLDING